MEKNLRDKVTNADLRDTANLSMAVADSIQRSGSVGSQVLAVCATFLMLSEQIGISVPDLIGYAKNIINDAQGRRVEFMAVEDYIKKEIIEHG